MKAKNLAMLAGAGALILAASAGLALHGAPPVRAAPPDSATVVRTLLATPDNHIDFAAAKLTIDKLVDPNIDVAASLEQIASMVAVVRAMAGPNADAIHRLAAVRRFIYVAGDWNGHHPFQYDMSDPFGRKIVNKLLPTYLATRRGNCVSMPILFVILADRLGVHVTLSTTPSHELVKYIDDTSGKAYNLETTSGGYPARDVWYRQNSPMTDDAIRNGVYLKTLSRKEALAVIADLALEYDMATGRYHALIDTADVILKYYPNDVDAMLSAGTAYAHLIDIEFQRKYPNPNNIPPDLIPVYQSYAQQNAALFDQAQALGWREPPNDGAPPPATGP